MSSKPGVLIVDPTSGTIEYCDRTAAALLGGEACGMEVQSLAPAGHDALMARFMEAPEVKPMVGRALEVPRLDGAGMVTLALGLVPINDGRVVVVMMEPSDLATRMFAIADQLDRGVPIVDEPNSGALFVG